MTMASLPDEAVHLPFDDGPFRMAMGLVACPEDDWLEIDARYHEEMAERRDLLAARHAEVFAACPGSEPARVEVLEVVAAHLVRRYPAWFMRECDTLHNALTGETWTLTAPHCDPLALAGLLVQEDLCLIRPGADAAVLEAAVVCAPSRWRLAEKIGRPLMAVHAPVPFYGDRLGSPVDRFMRQLKPGRIAVRMNWSIVDDPALFQPHAPSRHEACSPITSSNAGETLHFRMERQGFRLMERSGSVLFTIRVHSYPLARVVRLPGVAARLAGAVRALPPEMSAYKALVPFLDPLHAYLAAVA
ncbi:DUF3445 domain-containing protein [Elioraea sp.]|uniref:heme-dependent oxidative N-demethylase family protein n=1 Tax=Elioraea sp. TaxID=2185103 RepID=UPI0025BAC213|nr:DUF3445 domain-containing protein [Elioraea sp.]